MGEPPRAYPPSYQTSDAECLGLRDSLLLRKHDDWQLPRYSRKVASRYDQTKRRSRVVSYYGEDIIKN